MNSAISPVSYFVTSLWGHYSEALEITAKIPSDNSPVIFLGNYFDRGSEPGKILDFINLLKGNNSESRFSFLLFNHEESLLRLCGYLPELPDKRIHWISPYLGTHLTAREFGLHAWPSEVMENRAKEYPVIEFLLKLDSWKCLTLDSNLISVLSEQMLTEEQIQIYSYENNQLNLFDRILFKDDFFNQKIAPWVETEYRPKS